MSNKNECKPIPAGSDTTETVERLVADDSTPWNPPACLIASASKKDAPPAVPYVEPVYQAAALLEQQRTKITSKVILKRPDFQALATAALDALNAGETPVVEHIEVLDLLLDMVPEDTQFVYGHQTCAVQTMRNCRYEGGLDMRRSLPESVPGGLYLGRRVVCAANRSEPGTIILGARHFDAQMHEAMELKGGREAWLGSTQGFIDQHGEFLTREEAHTIATRQNQIVRRCGGDSTQLFSENLY